MWWNKGKPRKEVEQLQLSKVRESQVALINAATSTADAAHDVTSIMKERLNDSIIQIEATAKLLSDALIMCSETGFIQSFNPAAERIFGWESDSLKRRNAELLFRNNDGSPITFAEMINEMTSSQDVNDSFDLDNPLECLRGKRRNGDLFWVDVHMSRLARTDGTVAFMLLARDATKRMDIQRMLQLNEERYRSVFENSFDGIFVVNNHYVVAANPAIADLLGYEPDEMIAQPLTAFFHPDFHRVANIESRIRQQGDMSPKNYVIRGLRSDGLEVDLMISSTGMQWGDSLANLIFFKDITHLK